MRITNQIIDRTTIAGIQRNLASMDEARQRAMTGLRLWKASDDPASFVGVMSTDRRLVAIEQYSRNVASGTARMAAEESVLDQVGDILSRARQLAVSQAGSNGSTSTRLVTKAEVDGLFSTLVSLGNTQFGNAYLFGGDFADSQPFAANGSTSPSRPPAGGTSVEIGAGQRMAVTHDGMQVFVNSGAFAAVQRLAAGLGTDSDAEIAASITDLNQAFEGVQQLLGETGARGRQLEMASSNLDALGVNLKALLSDLKEVDLEEAVSQLVNRQTSYEAALLATSKAINTTLTDYLR